jgi:hypothetical protein
VELCLDAHPALRIQAVTVDGLRPFAWLHSAGRLLVRADLPSAGADQFVVLSIQCVCVVMCLLAGVREASGCVMRL